MYVLSTILAVQYICLDTEILFEQENAIRKDLDCISQCHLKNTRWLFLGFEAFPLLIQSVFLNS